MKRKGWDPEAEQMKTIVAIHNTVNEQSWTEVLRWESFHPCVTLCVLLTSCAH
jgi:cytochrome c heme-lyase